MAEKKKYTDIDLSKYDSGFKPTEAVNQASTLKTNAEAAVKNYGDFAYGRQGEYDNAMNSLLNRKGFSYDLNGDALYQQYKDNYITQGKQAMMDAAGQAAAMTGGYGNSYAQTVGQQTYQGYLQGLNDKIPELYQLALDRYNSEGDRLATNYGLLSSDRSNALAEHEAGYNKLVADRDYYANDYNSAYNRDYSTWSDSRTYDTSQYWNEYNTGYQAEQDALAHQLAADQLQLQKDQFTWQKEQAKVSGTTTGKAIDDSLPKGIVEKAQGFGNDIERANYLNDQAEKGYITDEQKNYILSQTLADDTIEYDGGRYYMVDNGGVNGFLGLGKWLGNIDDNAKVMAEDGQTYTMKQLYEMKKKEGLSDSKAKEWVVNLQKKVGAH